MGDKKSFLLHDKRAVMVVRSAYTTTFLPTTCRSFFVLLFLHLKLCTLWICRWWHVLGIDMEYFIKSHWGWPMTMNFIYCRIVLHIYAFLSSLLCKYELLELCFKHLSRYWDILWRYIKQRISKLLVILIDHDFLRKY